MRFNNIGTDKIGIGLCNKMGTQSLHALKSIKIKDTQDSVDDKKYVIILRDSFDKWESGYWQEVQMLYPILLEKDTELNIMWKMHDPMNSWYYTFNEREWATPWMYHGHGEFWKWNSAHESYSLGVCVQLPNVYFLELNGGFNENVFKYFVWLLVILF